MEIDHGLRVLREAVERRGSDGVKEALRAVGEPLRGRDIQMHPLEPHACCFTDPSSNRRLLHWALYGGHGTGIALGIDAAALARASEVELFKVIYDPGEQGRLMGAAVDDLNELTDRIAQETAPFDKSGRYRRDLLDSVGFSLPAFAATLKRPAFAEEQEWRLITSYNTEPPANGQKQLKFDGQVVGPVLRTFFEVEMEARHLRSVTIGPAYADLNESAFRMLIRESHKGKFNGAEVRVAEEAIVRPPFA